MKYLVIFVALYTTSAFAEAKHVKFTTDVVIDGQPFINEVKCPLVDGKRACQTPFTVGELAYMSLERSPVPGMAPQSWTDAIKRDDLAHAIRNADDFLLLDDQRTSIETAMAPIWSPSVLGFVSNVIDPPTQSAVPPQNGASPAK